MPTVLDALHLKSEQNVDGHSLLKIAREKLRYPDGRKRLRFGIILIIATKAINLAVLFEKASTNL